MKNRELSRPVLIILKWILKSTQINVARCKQGRLPVVSVVMNRKFPLRPMNPFNGMRVSHYTDLLQ